MPPIIASDKSCRGGTTTNGDAGGGITSCRFTKYDSADAANGKGGAKNPSRGGISIEQFWIYGPVINSPRFCVTLRLSLSPTPIRRCKSEPTNSPRETAGKNEFPAVSGRFTEAKFTRLNLSDFLLLPCCQIASLGIIVVVFASALSVQQLEKSRRHICMQIKENYCRRGPPAPQKPPQCPFGCSTAQIDANQVRPSSSSSSSPSSWGLI